MNNTTVLKKILCTYKKIDIFSFVLNVFHWIMRKCTDLKLFCKLFQYFNSLNTFQILKNEKKLSMQILYILISCMEWRCKKKDSSLSILHTLFNTRLNIVYDMNA